MKTLLYVLILLAVSVPPPLRAAADGDKKILYWVAPMDPNYRRDKPGKSPMGMDLIPVYAEDQDAGGADVTIPPEMVQSLGVRSAPVTRGRLSREIDTIGYVDYDESRVSHIHLRVSGWIERLAVASEGERVKRGQRLFNLYSPELVNAQEEYIQALQAKHERLIQASRDRLRALGLTKGQIKALGRRMRALQTLSIYAPQDGVVSDLPVREGMYVRPAMRVMALADLSSIWLLAEVFERQSEWVHTGDRAEVRLPFLPGRRWRGRVEYIYPALDPKTRTLRVRLRFANPDEALKPNMYAKVRLYAEPREDVLSVPLEALIRTGRAERVILALGKGRFAVREVVSGIESGDRVEIRKGLKEGDEVVVSGQFLIDSEASMRGALQRMAPAPEETATEKEDTAEEATAPIHGRGRVVALKPAAGKINLRHDPIPALGWPAMTMDFELGEGVSLEALKPGDPVRFTLRKGDTGIVITAIAVEKRP